MTIETRPPIIAPTGLGIALPLNYTFSDIDPSGLVEISLVIEGDIAVQWRLRPLVQSGIATVDVSEPIRQYLSGLAKVKQDVEEIELSCEYWLEGDEANKRVAVYAAALPKIVPQDIAGDFAPIVALPATNIQGGGFTANRELTEAYTRIDLQISLSETFNIIQQTISNALTAQSVGSLAENTTYFYRFVGFFLGVQVGFSNVIEAETSPLPIPEAPNTLDPTNITTTSLQANWEAVAQTQEYFLDVSETILFSTFVLENQSAGNSVSFNVTGLEPSTQYFYRVRASNGTGTSGNGDVGTGFTLIEVPVAVPASNVANMSFSANWQAVSGAVEYRVDVNTVSDFSGTIVRNNALATNLFLDITGLELNTEYFYRVRAVGASNTSGNSNVISITTLAIQSPVALPATIIGQADFVANWEAVDGAFEYRVDVARDSGFGTILRNNVNAGDDLLLIVTGLSAGVQYWYRVRAVGSLGTSENSNVITVTTTVVPAPVAIAATNIVPTSFRANWQAAATATSYRIDVATDSAFASMIRNNIIVGSVLFLNITSLTAGTQYWYRVRAANANGTSANSNIITLTTATSEPVPNAPVAIAATDINTNGFRARWNPVSNATSYRLDVLDSLENFVINNQNVGNVTNFVVTGLDSISWYTYRVRAVNGAGTSGNSNTITAETL